MILKDLRIIIDEFCDLHHLSHRDFSILIGREPHYLKKVWDRQWNVNIQDYIRILSVLGDDLERKLLSKINKRVRNIKISAQNETEKNLDGLVAKNLAKLKGVK